MPRSQERVRSATAVLSHPDVSPARRSLLLLVLAPPILILAGCGGGSDNEQSKTITSIEVTPANPSIVVGSEQQFKAMGVFSDGSQEDITSSVTWTSSDPATARISSSGLATSQTIGRPQITATSASSSGSSRLTIVIGSTLPVARFAYFAADNAVSSYIVIPPQACCAPPGTPRRARALELCLQL